MELEADVYERIEAERREGESFSEALERLLDDGDREPSLLSFAGLLDEDEAEAFEGAIEDANREYEEDLERRYEEVRDALTESEDSVGSD